MKGFVIIFAFLTSSIAFGQAPQKFNYQGVVRDNSGQVLDSKTIAVRISILDETATGTSIYSENHLVTTNQFGLFTLLIGNGDSSEGLFGDINWGNSNKFIKTEVDLAGGMSFKELGITQLLSVPYALYAEKSGGEIWRKSDIGVGTPSPVKNTYIENSIHSLITNTSLNGGVAIALDRSNDVNDSQVRFFTGNTANQPSMNHWNIGMDSNPTIYKNDFTIKYGLNGANPHLVIKETGNIGIGTTTDINSKLQVKGGDVYIDDISSGIILKSPNGNCWRVTVDDSGSLVRTPITCP